MNGKYITELEKALNPRRWDLELAEAWHRNIPDIQKAFDELGKIAKNRALNEEKNETHN